MRRNTQPADKAARRGRNIKKSPCYLRIFSTLLAKLVDIAAAVRLLRFPPLAFLLRHVYRRVTVLRWYGHCHLLQRKGNCVKWLHRCQKKKTLFRILTEYLRIKTNLYWVIILKYKVNTLIKFVSFFLTVEKMSFHNLASLFSGKLIEPADAY